MRYSSRDDTTMPYAEDAYQEPVKSDEDIEYINTKAREWSQTGLPSCKLAVHNA